VANVRGIVIGTNWLGAALPGLHKRYIDHVVEPTVDVCESVYNTGYGRAEKSAVKPQNFADFRKLTLHSTNGVVAFALAALA
ncbi:hypothetical protein ABTE41_19600, partial [Acinetobacter baumannii]